MSYLWADLIKVYNFEKSNGVNRPLIDVVKMFSEICGYFDTNNKIIANSYSFSIKTGISATKPQNHA